MSAKDDYDASKKLVESAQGFPPQVLVDKIRSAITGTRIDERTRASRLLKKWADSLDEHDEPWVAVWFREVADDVKNGLDSLPQFKIDRLPDEPLIAEDEDAL